MASMTWSDLVGERSGPDGGRTRVETWGARTGPVGGPEKERATMTIMREPAIAQNWAEGVEGEHHLGPTIHCTHADCDAYARELADHQPINLTPDGYARPSTCARTARRTRS